MTSTARKAKTTRSHTMKTRSMLKSKAIKNGEITTSMHKTPTTPLLPDFIIKTIRKKVIDLARQNLKEKCKSHLHRPTPDPYDSDDPEDMYDFDDFQGVVDFMLFYKEKIEAPDMDWIILHTPVLASRTYVNHFFDDERHFIRSIDTQSPILKLVRFLGLPVVIWSDFDYPKNCQKFDYGSYLPLDKKNSLKQLQTFINKCAKGLAYRGRLY